MHTSSIDLMSIVSTHIAVRDFIRETTKATDVAVLVPHLEQLAELLPHHFDQEESKGGFLDAIRQSVPGGSEHVSDLVREHDWFRLELPSLLGAATRYEADALSRVQEFALRLHEHERLEARLGVATPDLSNK